MKLTVDEVELKEGEGVTITTPDGKEVWVFFKDGCLTFFNQNSMDEDRCMELSDEGWRIFDGAEVS